MMVMVMLVVMVWGRRLRWGCSMEEGGTLEGAQGSRLFVCLVAMVVVVMVMVVGMPRATGVTC